MIDNDKILITRSEKTLILCLSYQLKLLIFWNLFPESMLYQSLIDLIHKISMSI